MTSRLSIESFPAEILREIFFQLGEKSSIGNSRLVSQQFRDAATPFLITRAHVRVTSQSLEDLETLSDHPIYSRSITTIRIVTSYYIPQMADDRTLYVSDISAKLFRLAELMERMRGPRYREGDETEESQDKVTNWLFRHAQSEELATMRLHDFDESRATPFQQLVIRLHGMYQQRCRDQEQARQGDAHIGRICVALRKFPNLHELAFKDLPWSRTTRMKEAYFWDKVKEKDFKDLGFKQDVLKCFNSSLSPEAWSGHFATADIMTPPVEMLGELYSQLGRTGTRPRCISLQICLPPQMDPFMLSPEQQEGVRLLVSRAKRLHVMVADWERVGRSRYAPDHGRSSDELLALGSFTQPLFAAPEVESLSLAMHQCNPSADEEYNSVFNFLPKDHPWPELKVLHLGCIPMTLGELRILVAQQRDTLTALFLQEGWLQNGDYAEMAETLRGLHRLTKAQLSYLKDLDEASHKEITAYILRKRKTNPMLPPQSDKQASE